LNNLLHQLSPEVVFWGVWPQPEVFLEKKLDRK